METGAVHNSRQTPSTRVETERDRGFDPPADDPPPGDADSYEANLETWDSDRDGYLTEAELEAAMADPANSGDDAAMLVALYHANEDLRKASDDQPLWETGISRADLRAVELAAANGEDLGGVAGLQGHFAARIAGASRELFPTGAPDPNALQQGMYGDCFMVAALAGLASSRPEDIVDMIEENDD